MAILVAWLAMVCVVGAHATPVQWAVASGGTVIVRSGERGPAGITWTNAEAAAVARGGHLASITSAGENAFIYGLINVDDWANWWTEYGGGCSGRGSVATRTTVSGYSEPAGGWHWSNGDAWGYDNWGPDASKWWLNNASGGIEDYASSSE